MCKIKYQYTLAYQYRADEYEITKDYVELPVLTITNVKCDTAKEVMEWFEKNGGDHDRTCSPTIIKTEEYDESLF